MARRDQVANARFIAIHEPYEGGVENTKIEKLALFPILKIRMKS